MRPFLGVLGRNGALPRVPPPAKSSGNIPTTIRDQRQSVAPFFFSFFFFFSGWTCVNEGEEQGESPTPCLCAPVFRAPRVSFFSFPLFPGGGLVEQCFSSFNVSWFILVPVPFSFLPWANYERAQPPTQKGPRLGLFFFSFLLENQPKKSGRTALPPVFTTKAGGHGRPSLLPSSFFVWPTGQATFHRGSFATQPG